MSVNVQTELQQIADDNGGVLRPEDVIEFARDPATSLHTHFQWDDTEAARLYRITQARAVIRVAVTIVEGRTEPIRAWVSLTPDREHGGGYRSLVSVMSDEDRRETLLRDAINDFERFKRKYQTLSELAPVFEAARGVKKTNRRRKSA